MISGTANQMGLAKDARNSPEKSVDWIAEQASAQQETRLSSTFWQMPKREK